ncbi:uncharacterized protein LOC131619951 [Vicia villosa]|uniref:uncharacterized protein LOC131619951 n=1 Tax=Vicia villosa TaxID=3911 RepID=UPI00273C323C|nr:uncharacterized protein LOC131619951 [Vicia villosa]
MHVICGGEVSNLSSSSFWWRDLLKVGFLTPFEKDPFVSNCLFYVGNGFSTPFWEACWLNNVCLMEAFPELYRVSSLKKVSVAAMGGWCEGVWKWGNLGIPEGAALEAGLFVKLLELRALLESHGGLHDEKDTVAWLLNSVKGFSVASCYHRYTILRTPFGPHNRNDVVLEKVWKMEVPFKIKAFAWRLFVNRLPTKDLLMQLENRDHLFFNCDVSKVVWNEIALWVDLPGWNGEDCIPFFMEWFSMGHVKNIKGGKLGVLWLATCWIIWLTRNDFCFRNDSWNINNIVWNIKILVWRWSAYGNIAYPNCSFYDFSKDPLSFMS